MRVAVDVHYVRGVWGELSVLVDYVVVTIVDERMVVSRGSWKHLRVLAHSNNI